jgi:CcmD family protein
MSTLGFLALAYGLTWAIVAVYAVFIARRQHAVRRQLEELQLEFNDLAERSGKER